MATLAETLDLGGEARTFFDSYFAAVGASDLERIVGHYAPEVVGYDAILQFEFRGREAYKAHWKACMEMCQHMSFEPQQPEIFASGDLATAHCLVRCGGSGPDGEEQSGWVRLTLIAQKRDGRWQIVHDHYSVPFDPQSFKALVDLEP